MGGGGLRFAPVAYSALRSCHGCFGRREVLVLRSLADRVYPIRHGLQSRFGVLQRRSTARTSRASSVAPYITEHVE